ncbi:MAG: hypothetical protein KAJ04_06965 [Candidatus Eisenbacteria sp.]|nr:hypothetical protein [Candidatus Eisenbacteria bacterium]
MNNKMRGIIALLIVLGLAVGVTGCKLLHEKVVDVVLRNSAAIDFEVREDSANYVGDPQVIDIAEGIDDALGGFDPPLERVKIKEAGLLAATYEVTWLEDPGHDWEISGRIWMQYGQAESVIIDYSEQSLYDALGAGEISAELNASGVTLFNQALDDFRSGQDPVLSFWMDGDGCIPQPSAQDSLKFDWTARIYMYVVSPVTLEVPDLFE